MSDDYEIKKTVDDDGTEHVQIIMKNAKISKKGEKKLESNPKKDA